MIYKARILSLFTLLVLSLKAFAQKPVPEIKFPSSVSTTIEIGEYYDPGAESTNTGTPILYASSNLDVAIVEGGVRIKIVGLGITTITATQPETASFSAARASTTLKVQQPQTITFPAIADKLICDIDFAPGANSDFDEIPITYTCSNLSVATITASGKIHIVGPGTTTITANQAGNDKYIVAPSQSQQLTVLATCFPINNAFTPNGDGVNDVWNIPDLANYPDCLMRVFNRSGQLVFQSKGYTKAWDGTYNGQQLPFATYYYVLSLDNASAKKVSGAVTIIR